MLLESLIKEKEQPRTGGVIPILACMENVQRGPAIPLTARCVNAA